MVPLIAAFVVVVGGVALTRRYLGDSNSHRDKNDEGGSDGAGTSGRSRAISFNSEVMLKSFPPVRACGLCGVACRAP